MERIFPDAVLTLTPHDDQYTEQDVDLSVFLPVGEGAHVEAPLKILDLPERDRLVARVQGSYDQISQAHDLINARIASAEAPRACTLYSTPVAKRCGRPRMRS